MLSVGMIYLCFEWGRGGFNCCSRFACSKHYWGYLCLW